MLIRVFAGFAILSFLFMSYGCGEKTAPVDTVITIYPDKGEVTDKTATPSVSTQYFRIVVTKKDINDKTLPVNDAEIWIDFIWAVPDAVGLVQLYDGDTPVDSPMSVKTDDHGVYNLRVDFLHGGGLEYTGNIEISSGSAFELAEFSVDAG